MSDNREAGGRRQDAGTEQQNHAPVEATQRPDPAGDQKMAQLRELMFGGMARDFDRRLRDMEARLAADSERLSADLERRVAGLESKLSPQLEKLADQLRTESEARTRALDDAESRSGQALRTLREDIGTTLRSHEREAELAETRHREAVSSARTDLQDALQALRQALAGARDELGQQKLAREDFADMLAELALRLRMDGTSASD